MMMNRLLLVFLAGIALSACNLVPDYARPAVDAPDAFSSSPSPETKISADWWKTYESDELNALMVEALVSNNDLRASLQRIEQARAGLRIAGASLLPGVDASGSAGRTLTRPGTDKNSWRAGGGVSYELDLFGANRAAAQSAAASLAGSRYDHDALALVVMGEVADGYFNLLSLRERVSIAEKNLKISNDILGIVNARYKAGASTALDVAQQKSALASAEASLASLRQQETAAGDALAVLLGIPPQALSVAGKNLDGLNVPVIAPGQPSELLQRRPDIASAEAALKAANADIGAARAAFFPSISLSADFAVSGNPVIKTLSLASALSAPIFQGGKLEGGLQKANARQAELVEVYQKAVLTSFQDVGDALASVKAARSREVSLAKAKQEAQKSLTLSQELYKAGSVDFQTLLNAQASLLGAEESYAAVRLEMLQATTALYKALGGGWGPAVAE